MAIEKVKETLEKLMADPKAKELFKGLEPPKSEEEKALKIVEAAKKLGYDLEAADLAEYLQKAAADQKKKTEAQAEAIQMLDDSEVERAVGGLNHDNCEDTFLDYENCWYDDGCDNIFQIYDEYICHRGFFTDHCHQTAVPCDHDYYYQN